MSLILESPSRPQVPILGRAEAFPVRRIFCVGLNYAAHTREMGKDPDRAPPFFFTKFCDAAVPLGGEIAYPPATSNYHFEAEMVIAIGKSGRFLSPDEALGIVYGYAAGLDMTRRDLQAGAKEKGLPWDIGKNFAQSAPIGPISPVETCGHKNSGAIRLTVNGETKQDADLADMIWDCANIISFLSGFEALLPGDLIYSGTPAGVGPVKPGDKIEVTIDGLTSLQVQIGKALTRAK